MLQSLEYETVKLLNTLQSSNTFNITICFSFQPIDKA